MVTTVLLVHALGGTGRTTWRHVLPALPDRVRVLAPDLPRHGDGPRGGPVSMRACVDTVLAALDEAGAERAVLGGYSLGGAVAQHLARAHPDRVSGLVLAATSARLHRPTPVSQAFAAAEAAMAGVRRVGRTPPVRRAAGRLAGPLADDWLDSDPDVGLAYLPVLREHDARPWVGDLAVPTAVVVTTRDVLVPPRSQLALARATGATSDGRVERVAAGHGACLIAPARFVPAFLRALDSVAP